MMGVNTLIIWHQFKFIFSLFLLKLIFLYQEENYMKKISAILAMVASAIIIPAALYAWGPERPSFTTASPANYITFNSIVDNPSHGDERNFVQVRDAAASNNTYSDQINISDGREYVVYMYFHNNAAENLNLVANGTYAKFEVPGLVKKGSTGTKAVGYIGATNAVPKEVWDDITFINTTSGDLSLKFVPGSATLHTFGAANNSKMSDNIVTTGALVGYNALDGNVQGCNQYAGYVTFRVRAGNPNFTVVKQVRKTGTTTWSSEPISVKAGDSIDYLITYTNTGTIGQTNVVIKDNLPEGIIYTEGTTFLANAANPTGNYKFDDSIIKGNGINIGDYAPGATGIVKFSAVVTSNDKLATCGANTLKNSVTVTTDNGSKTTTVDVIATKTCATDTTPSQLPTTGAGETLAALFGIGSLTASIAYYIDSKKLALGRR